MKKITLKEMADACMGSLVCADEDTVVTGGVVDSRQLEKGNLFFAILGEKVDGHKFAGQVIENGAAAAVIEHEVEGVTEGIIKVESTGKALLSAAGCYRNGFDIPVIGITGSVGKTSTKEMIASVLGEKFNVLKTEGNFNNEIGMPLTLFKVRESHEAAVVEMGINHFGEMDRMAAVARPDMFVITNIGDCHLEFLGDRDGVLAAKTEGLDYMADGAPLILNGDDEKLVSLKGNQRFKVLFYSLENKDAAAYASDIVTNGEEGSDFTLHIADKEVRVHVPVAGRHMVANALAAALVGNEMGMDIDAIKSGIEKVKTISGRSNFIKKGGVTIIDDCYNANPNSMKASLEVLSNCTGRRIAVLGDMGELGEGERALHYEVGEYLATLGLDAVFFSGSLAEEISRGAGDNGAENLFYIKEKETMSDILCHYIKPGDTVLVKASHFMQFDSLINDLINSLE